MTERAAARLGLAVVSTVIALASAEAATRWLGGFGFRARLHIEQTSEQISPSPSQKLLGRNDAMEHASRLPVASGVDRQWYAVDPPLAGREVDPMLKRRYREQDEGFELPSEYEWNRQYVMNAVCESRPRLPVFSHVDDLYLFDPVDGSTRPPFRFLRNIRYPSGLRTNSFGWRGADVSLNKPARTIRIAFVGASTTIDPHGDAFSYPEYVGRWLNEWSLARGYGVRFESINAGREGVDSTSIAAIVATELVPVRPDLVVYYEGSNQFWPADYISDELPPRPRQVAKPIPPIERYSALALRAHSAWNAWREGYEPPKPAIRVNWPATLDEHDPPLSDPRLPVQLPVILRDLEAISAAVSSYGGTLVPSSFVWLVHRGLVLDRRRDAGLYSYLNESYWPFSYAHMRRLIDFQNRVFRKYAVSSRLLPFNDVASVYPRDPRLFLDAIHMTPAGIKLKAWLVFQQLVPHLAARIADGRLPLRDEGGRTVHPAFTTGGPSLTRLDDVRRLCS